MSTVLLLLVAVPTVIVVVGGVYASGALFGRWDRPQRGSVVLPPPRPALAAPQPPAPRPQPPAPPALPPAPPPLAEATEAFVVHAMQQPPRMAKGSIPPPLPSSVRSRAALPLPATRPPTPSVIVDFSREDATMPDPPPGARN